VADTGTLAQVDGRADAETDERALVERARADPAAFAELYRRYLPRVHAFAYRRTGIVEVAEDITSAAFERALRNLGSFRWQAGGFGPWLFRIVSNELADHYRRAGRASSDRAAAAAAHLLGDGPRDPADELAARDAATELLVAMDALNPRYQRALELRYFAGLTPEEAAVALGVSRATMAVVVHRATRALRRALDEGETRS
jgi:RNA polymerase sigma-70 factor (ECF subfamily)